jgi:hypothetical protein
MDLSERSVEVLSGCGWSEGRHTDPQQYVNALEPAGKPIPDVVLQFLSRFGGIECSFATSEKVDGTPPYVVPDSFRVFVPNYRGYLYFIHLWREALGLQLYPVGICHGDSLLAMDKWGRMYSAIDGYLALLGESWQEAIDSLIMGRECNVGFDAAELGRRGRV